MKIVSKSNVEKGKVELPEQFKENIRPDLIKKAVLAIQNNSNRKSFCKQY